MRVFTWLIALLVAGAPAFRTTSAGDPAQHAGTTRNCIVVTPQGPRDGGDFGPHTPGTRTSGLQEAFLAAKAQVKDVYISGGSWTESQTQPVVYFLQDTLRIPWMQNFRCDSGNCVIHYSPTEGDAVVFDSQMSCSYRLGLIVSMSSGAAVRLKPTTAGPDRFKVITSTDFSINALVGGGGAWPSGEAYNSQLDKQRKWIGTGLLLDASDGAIDANRIYVTEIVGCGRGLHLTGACTHNAIEVTTIHLSQTHIQLGDERDMPAVVRANRIAAHLEAQGIADSAGANIYGIDNLLTISSEGMAPHRDILFGPQAEGNLVTAARFAGYTNQARSSTNRILNAADCGRLTVAPPVPDSGAQVVNRHPWPVVVRIVSPGQVRSWVETPASGEPIVLAGPLAVGQTILLNPGDAVRIDYSDPPTWSWKALQ